MVAAGEKVGVVKVRLFRPFSAEALVAALPTSVRAVAVLDRTKEPGAPGEPLYQDVVTALAEEVAAGRARFPDRMPRVIGGRYGLSSKEFTPAMAKAALDELDDEEPRTHFTVGIVDDVSHTSLPVDPDFDTEPDDVVRAVFFGLGSDGTVSANKNSIKIIGEHTDLHAQGYFVYDSKKAGGVTVSHLRFGPNPIRSTYLIREARLRRVPPVRAPRAHRRARRGRAGCDLPPEQPVRTRRRSGHSSPRRPAAQIVDKGLRFFVVDGYAVAKEAGLGTRINTVMQTCFFALAEILPPRRRDRSDQAGDREVLRQARRDRAHAQLRRGRRRDRARCTRWRCRRRVGEGSDDAPAGPGPGARLRPARDRGDDRGRGRPPAGERAARRRDVPDRHRALGEAEHRARDPGVGPGDLHRLREVRAGLPARRHPDEGLRARGRRGRARRASSTRSGRIASTPAAG